MVDVTLQNYSKAQPAAVTLRPREHHRLRLCNPKITAFAASRMFNTCALSSFHSLRLSWLNRVLIKSTTSSKTALFCIFLETQLRCTAIFALQIHTRYYKLIVTNSITTTSLKYAFCRRRWRRPCRWGHTKQAIHTRLLILQPFGCASFIQSLYNTTSLLLLLLFCNPCVCGQMTRWIHMHRKTIFISRRNDITSTNLAIPPISNNHSIHYYSFLAITEAWLLSKLTLTLSTNDTIDRDTG